MRRNQRTAIASLLSLVALSGLLATHTQMYAYDRSSQSAIGRASKFLGSQTTGKYVLGFVHLGARYDGHELASVRTVTRQGTPVPGHFALVYDYSCENDGRTQIAFLCDHGGKVYDVQILDHNGVLNTPYTLAKLSIDVLGNALLDAFKDNMSSSDRSQLQTMIRNADPEAMLKMGLRLRQAFAQ